MQATEIQSMEENNKLVFNREIFLLRSRDRDNRVSSREFQNQFHECGMSSGWLHLYTL